MYFPAYLYVCKTFSPSAVTPSPKFHRNLAFRSGSSLRPTPYPANVIGTPTPIVVSRFLIYALIFGGSGIVPLVVDAELCVSSGSVFDSASSSLLLSSLSSLLLSFSSSSTSPGAPGVGAAETQPDEVF